ncbi:MAG: GNAT family N-acetyltransferase, partial [Pseudomonadota bacterium]
FIDRVQDKDVWVMCSENNVIGVIGFDDEFGYWVTPAAWGQGYATEAARAVLDWYFTKGAVKTQSRYLYGNAPSANVLSKLGFREIGVETCSSRAAGENLPARRVELTRAMWDTIR